MSMMATIVEDDDNSYILVESILRHLGYDVSRAPNDLNQFSRHLSGVLASDLIVLDIMLSEDLDGFDVIRLLAEGQFDGNLIVASANAPKYISAMMGVAEGNGIHILSGIEKPYRLEKFQELLAGHVENRELSSSRF